MISTEISVEDCNDYDNFTTENTNKWSASGTVTRTYSNEGMSIKCSSGSKYIYQKTLPSTFEAQLTVISTQTGGGTFMNVLGNGMIPELARIRLTKTNAGVLNDYSHDFVSGDVLKWVYDGINMYYYLNNTLMYTSTPNTSQIWFELWGSQPIIYKDFKIKPL